MTPQDLVLTPRGIRFRGRLVPVSIGRCGIRSDKREGDGATPRGKHILTGLYYRPDRLARPAPWAVPIGPRDLWSDDARDPDYNHHVCAPHAFSHEKLRRADPLYDLILTTDWNWPDAKPGHGSAIFLHIWRKPRHPTEGCIAFNRGCLLRLLPKMPPGSRLIVP